MNQSALILKTLDQVNTVTDGGDAAGAKFPSFRRLTDARRRKEKEKDGKQMFSSTHSILPLDVD